MSDRTSSTPSAPSVDLLNQQAAEWLVRRAGDDWTAETQQAWQHWLQQGPAHQRAYAHAERIWEELGGLGALGAQGSAAPAPQAPWQPPQPVAARPLRRRLLWQGMAATVMATAVVWVGTAVQPWKNVRADFHTAVGERRAFVLPDGSRMQLGGDSAVAVHYGADQRRVELLRGEALFDALPVSTAGAAPEPRPFVVAAAQGRTRALGTRFIVERLEKYTRVTGVEHKVQVALDAAPQSSVVVAPGQLVRYDQQGLGPLQAVSGDPGRAWAQGQMVFERMALSDVVARLNRYHSGRIVVGNAALAQRLVSGVFPAADAPAALQAVAQELGARLLHLPGWVLVY